MAEKLHLLIIDPQRGFAQEIGDPSDLVSAASEQQKKKDGELCIPGGMAALDNVAELIRDHGDDITDITITMDCHQEIHIAHPIWFRFPTKPSEPFISVDGIQRPTYCEVEVRRKVQCSPAPFSTMIEKNGKIVNGVLDSTGNLHEIAEVNCTQLNFTRWTVDYLKFLFTGGRYPHMIWPPHCRIGTRSNVLVDSVMDAMLGWEREQFGLANKITKGSNIKTEHFGAVHAEVPDPDDPTTQVNTHFVKLLSDTEQRIAICGLARGHCLANTARDIAKQFPNPKEFISRLVLLADGTADVPNLEFLGDGFVSDFQPQGMDVMNCKELFAGAFV